MPARTPAQTERSYKKTESSKSLGWASALVFDHAPLLSPGVHLGSGRQMGGGGGRWAGQEIKKIKSTNPIHIHPPCYIDADL